MVSSHFWFRAIAIPARPNRVIDREGDLLRTRRQCGVAAIRWDPATLSDGKRRRQDLASERTYNPKNTIRRTGEQVAATTSELHEQSAFEMLRPLALPSRNAEPTNSPPQPPARLVNLEDGSDQLSLLRSRYHSLNSTAAAASLISATNRAAHGADLTVCAKSWSAKGDDEQP